MLLMIVQNSMTYILTPGLGGSDQQTEIYYSIHYL